ncbi:tRNA (guanosine(37)-N1)-methyltransferase TrmD [Methylothermus subterraneus]
MRFDVITLFPEMVDHACRFGVTGRARKRGLMRLVLWNPRDFSRDRHRTVDDRPYGGGPGMVLKVQPLRDAIRAAKADAGGRTPVVYLSPQGARLDQAAIQRFAATAGMILVAGRYEGIDQRVLEREIDEEWSIGDYVLSGGELAALVLIDAVTRLLPGALGDAESAGQDSYADGLLDHPHYTRPAEIDGQRVPEVLLSGDHRAIARWRKKQALGRTWLRRPDLLARRTLDAEEQLLLEEFKRELEQQHGQYH